MSVRKQELLERLNKAEYEADLQHCRDTVRRYQEILGLIPGGSVAFEEFCKFRKSMEDFARAHYVDPKDWTADRLCRFLGNETITIIKQSI